MLDKIVSKVFKSKGDERQNYIFMSAIVGIIANLILVAIKLSIGVASHSIAIISDATNNLGDSASSIITIFGIKIASKPATKKHPFGYGRVEYMSALIISVLLLVAGFQFLLSAFNTIMHPVKVSFNTVSIVLIFISVLAKLALGSFNKNIGNKVNSTALKASGADAIVDAIVSSITLLSAIVSRFTDFAIDGYVTLVVSGFIIYSGIELVKETISSIIGERPDLDLANNIKTEVKKFESVLGAYDLILHNYGPTKYIGSINVELNHNLNIGEAHIILHRIRKTILEKYNTFLVLGIYSVNKDDEHALKLRRDIQEIIGGNEHILGAHGLHLDREKFLISFDIVTDFLVGNEGLLRKEIMGKLKEKYGEYSILINIDKDFS